MRPVVVGVINLSPESRNTHTVVTGPDEALALARRYRQMGVEVVDVGAQSSRYDVPTLSASEEIDRLVPSVERLSSDGFVVSVDTWKPEVAEAAVHAGARLVNDAGGLTDPRMRKLVADSGAVGILVYLEAADPHRVGEFRWSPHKAEDVAAELGRRLEELRAEGIDRLVVDPGIAFNYRGDYRTYTSLQVEVIRGLDHLRRLGPPVMVAVPRKAEDHRVVAFITLAIEHGADLLRVHDVAWAADLVDLLGSDGDLPWDF